VKLKIWQFNCPVGLRQGVETGPGRLTHSENNSPGQISKIQKNNGKD
jgi:hypothetical protein